MASELHVDAIKHSGGTSALTIDSTGRILMPARPAFNVWYSGSNLASVATIVWNNEEINVGSHYDTSNGRFTAPITGIYSFSWFAISTSGTEFGTILAIDGSESSHVYTFSNAASGDNQFESGSGSTLLSLNAGQYVEIKCKNGTMLGAANYHNNFCGYLLG